MTNVAAIFEIFAGVIGFIGIGATLWAYARMTGNDARIKRLTGENTEMIARLNYIEPRFDTLGKQNEFLLALHDPSEKYDALKAQGQDNHVETVELLKAQSVELQDIRDHLRGQS